ncbi:MAG: hypothetical protein LUF33_01970 [Clostridiales bacterium]|nr:hypothetical protein [Clostridiales bacterium]
MGLKIETWTIAYRAKKQGLILKDLNDFTIIKNGRKGWYADPFLFEYEDDTYLFAEYFSYKLRRGIIVCSKYDKLKDKFDKYKEIISEAYHLSYPFVFKYNDEIYMMPEANESKNIVCL